MAKKSIIKEGATTVYPQTLASCVMATNGGATFTLQDLANLGYTFVGVASLLTTPVICDARIFYVAGGPGTYANFGDLEVATGELAFFLFDGTDWTKASVSLPYNIQFTSGEQMGLILATISFNGHDYQIKAEIKDTEPIQNSSHPVTSDGVFTALQNLLQSIGETLQEDYYNKDQADARFIPTTDIVDNLEGNDSDKVLSAKQGKILNTAKANRPEVIKTGVAELDENGDLVSSGVSANNLVQKNDVSDALIAGSAKSLMGETVGAEYTNRVTAGGADIGNGAAIIERIKGKTLVWNQLVWNGNFAATTGWSGTYSISDGIMTLNGGSYTNASQAISNNPAVGHKIYMSAVHRGGAGNVQLGGGADGYTFAASTGWTRTTTIKTRSLTGTYLLLYKTSATDVEFAFVMLVDLTKMFGSGNEPSTAAEFEALFPLNYYAYNTGSLLNFTATGLQTNGFNQWDEEWENGKYNTTTGEADDAPTQIRSKNYIPVFGGTDYYFQFPLGVGNLIIMRYDIDKNYLGYNAIQPSARTLSADTRFIRFYMTVTYGTTYKNDICINLSDVNKNGTYEPYKKDTLELNITDLVPANKPTLRLNQAAPELDGGWGKNGVTYTFADGVATITATSTGSRSITKISPTAGVVEHKYLFITEMKADAPINGGCGFAGRYRPTIWPLTTEWRRYALIDTGLSTDAHVYVYGSISDVSVKFYARNPMVIDLTEMYGAGNEPTNIAFIEEQIGTDYIPYNTGEDIPNRIYPKGAKSAGTAFDVIRRTDTDRVIGVVDLGTLNWLKSSFGSYSYTGFYSTGLSSLMSAPNTNLICTRYATKQTFSAPNIDKAITNATHISAGNICIVDSAYNNSTAADFKAAMSGVYLYYELATPEHFDLLNPLNLNYGVEKLGMETVLPQNGSVPVTAPLVCDVRYPMNTNKNFIAKNSMDSVLGALVTAGIISSYTLTWNAATEKYDCTITR